MRAYYYTVNNDYDRIFFDPDGKNWFTDLISLILDFDPAVIPVFIFIIIFMCLMPIIAICKDRSDYEAIKSDEYEVDDELIKKMALRKRLPFESVLYNKKLYA